MALTREQKKAIIEKITDTLKKANAVVFVNFHGISVALATEMRRGLGSRGVGYAVVKKTLARRALDASGITGVRPELSGELAIAYGADDVESAKAVAEFAKKFEDRVKLIGGALASVYLSEREVLALSRIPSRHILYGQLANVINSPIQGTVSVLSGVMRSFAIALNQIAEKKG